MNSVRRAIAAPDLAAAGIVMVAVSLGCSPSTEERLRSKYDDNGSSLAFADCIDGRTGYPGWILKEVPCDSPRSEDEGIVRYVVVDVIEGIGSYKHASSMACTENGWDHPIEAITVSPTDDGSVMLRRALALRSGSPADLGL